MYFLYVLFLSQFILKRSWIIAEKNIYTYRTPRLKTDEIIVAYFPLSCHQEKRFGVYPNNLQASNFSILFSQTFWRGGQKEGNELHQKVGFYLSLFLKDWGEKIKYLGISLLLTILQLGFCTYYSDTALT